MKKIICLASALCLFLYSCSKDSDKTLSLSENNVEFTSIGGEQQIAVSAYTEWEVKYDVDWFNAETSGNMSNGSIAITVQTNYFNTDRSAQIIVTTPSGYILGEIIVSQKGHIGISPLQVYNEDWTPFKGNIELVGIPLASHGSFNSPGWFPSSTQDIGNLRPWAINGEVKGGIMNINFPTDKLELTSEYQSWTKGLTMAELHIDQKDSQSRKFFLHKKGGDYDNIVHILYVENDFTNELVTFKPGWNFIEIYRNPNWEYGNDEPYRLIGIISQDINVFLEKGYRWQIEYWI